MIQINGKEIMSTTGFLHRKGSMMYFKTCVLLPNETADNFEEVDEIPKDEEFPEEFNSENLNE